MTRPISTVNISMATKRKEFADKKRRLRDSFHPIPGAFSTFMATFGNGAAIGMASTRPRNPLIIKAPQMGTSVSSLAVPGTRFQGGAVLPIVRVLIPRKAEKTWDFVFVLAKNEIEPKEDLTCEGQL